MAKDNACDSGCEQFGCKVHFEALRIPFEFSKRPGLHRVVFVKSGRFR